MKATVKQPPTDQSKRRPMTILITDAQRQYLTAVCRFHGLPGTPLASMAATCFTRGLTIIGEAIGISSTPPE